MTPRWPALLSVLFGALLLMAAALYNGYPLTFWDTRAYVEHAGTLLPRPDRLIGYSVFIRLLSWKLTLWPVVVAQCLLVAWLVRRTAQVLSGRAAEAGHLLLIALLTFGTALPWIAGQLMADIFTPILVLALWLLVHAPALGRRQRAGLLCVVALCVAVHLTHFPIGVALLVVAAATLRASGAGAIGAALRAPALALLLGLCAIGGFNFARSGRMSLASGGDAFLLGHLVESGIASRILNEHCPERDYMLCPHRAKLPMSVDNLLWVDVLALDPWAHPAQITREAHRLLRDSLLEHPLLHLQVAASYTLRVLGRFRTGEGLDSDAQSLIDPQLAAYAPYDLPAYRAARQQHDAIPVTQLRSIHTPIGWSMLVCSAVWLAWHARKRSRASALQDPSASFLVFVLAALLFNATISGNMSGVYDRYEARLLWLLGIGLWAACQRHRARNPEQARS